MAKFLHSFKDNFGKYLAFFGIVAVFQFGKSCEESKREEIIRSESQEKNNKIFELNQKLNYHEYVEGNLKKTISSFNETELSQKIRDLQLRKEDLELNQENTDFLISQLKDSINYFKQNQGKLKELNIVIKKKENQIIEINSNLQETQIQLRNLRDTICTIGVRNFQLTSDLSRSEMKYDNLSNSLFCLQEAFYYERKAEDVKCQKHERLPFLFKAYQAYEKARRLKVFRKIDLWRIICKMNKLDKDGDRWVITVKGITHEIESNLYKDMLTNKKLTRRGTQSIEG